MWHFFKHLLNGESKTVTSAAVVLAATSLASRFVGLIRDRVLAATFGAGPELDVYYAAFRIPDFIYNLLVLGALSAGFIPLFTEALVRRDKKREDAWRIANGVLNLLTVSLVVITALSALLAPLLMKMVAPGFSPTQLAVTTLLTRIMFLSPLFLGISAVFGGILQSFKRFVVFSLGPILYNIGIIIGAAIFARWWGLTGLAIGVVLGSFLHMAVQIPAVRELGYSYKWFLTLRDTFVTEIMRLMLPRTLGLAVTQFNLLAMTVIASTLREGSISVFNLANNFQSFAVGIIGISFAIAVFPTLSDAAARSDRKDLVEHFGATTRQILLFIVPASILFLLLRAQIVRVVLGSGAFDWEATVLTADTLAFFTLSLIAQAVLPLLTRVYYATKDTLTPFVVGLVAVLMNIGFALWLKDILGVRGLALAFSIASWVNVILLWVTLRIKLVSLGELRILRSFYKMAAAGLVMAVVVQALKFPLAWLLPTEKFFGIFLQGFIAGIIGLCFYATLGILLKSEEITLFVASLRKKLFRKYAPSEAADEAVGP